MRPRRRPEHFLLPAVRGCVALVALLGYLASSIGFPAPAPSAAREQGNDKGRPGACRGHACGCTGADHCCCSGHQEATAPAPPSEEGSCPLCAAPAPTAESAVIWVSSFQVRHCRGLDALWYTLGAVLPPAPPLAWAYDWKPSGWLAGLPHAAASLSSAPPSPPPRA